MYGIRYICPMGYYGNTTQLSSIHCTDICPLGHYCPIGSTTPIPCPAGSYGNTTGLGTNICSGLCQKGIVYYTILYILYCTIIYYNIL